MDTSARAVRLLAIATGCDLAFLAVSSARGPASPVSQEFRTLPVQEELFEKVENMSIIQVTAPAISFDGALFDDDPEFLAEIVNLFLETYPQLLASIEETISKKDAPGLCRAAHTMKGAVANFGAKAVVEQAKALEMMGKSGDLSSADAGWRSLRALMEAFVPEIEAALKSVTEEQVAM